MQSEEGDGAVVAPASRLRGNDEPFNPWHLLEDPGGAGVPNADDALFQGTAGDSKQLAIRAELERGDIVM